jgi:hypothetical protein
MDPTRINDPSSAHKDGTGNPVISYRFFGQPHEFDSPVFLERWVAKSRCFLSRGHFDWRPGCCGTFHEVRLKGRIVASELITRATVGTSGSVKKPAILLTLGTSGRLSGTVMLRDQHDTPMSETGRAALLALLRASNIAMPISPDDPTGKFARYNFPGHLTKSDVIALVEMNPSTSKPIPGLPRWS